MTTSSNLNTRPLNRLVTDLLSPDGVADSARTAGVVVALLGELHRVISRDDCPLRNSKLLHFIDEQTEKALDWSSELGIVLPVGPQEPEPPDVS